MSVVDGRDAADRPRDVVEDAVDNVRRDIEFCHAGSGRAPEIVQHPLPYRCFCGFLTGVRQLFAKQDEHSRV